jgi:hypothetical protein
LPFKDSNNLIDNLPAAFYSITGTGDDDVFLLGAYPAGSSARTQTI